MQVKQFLTELFAIMDHLYCELLECSLAHLFLHLSLCTGGRASGDASFSWTAGAGVRPPGGQGPSERRLHQRLCRTQKHPWSTGERAAMGSSQLGSNMNPFSVCNRVLINLTASASTTEVHLKYCFVAVLIEPQVLHEVMSCIHQAKLRLNSATEGN